MTITRVIPRVITTVVTVVLDDLPSTCGPSGSSLPFFVVDNYLGLLK